VDPLDKVVEAFNSERNLWRIIPRFNDLWIIARWNPGKDEWEEKDRVGTSEDAVKRHRELSEDAAMCTALLALAEAEPTEEMRDAGHMDYPYREMSWDDLLDAWRRITRAAAERTK